MQFIAGVCSRGGAAVARCAGAAAHWDIRAWPRQVFVFLRCVRDAVQHALRLLPRAPCLCVYCSCVCVRGVRARVRGASLGVCVSQSTLIYPR